MVFILQDVCLKCLPKICSMGNCKELLDIVLKSISQDTTVIYRYGDLVSSSFKKLESAGYIVSTEIDKTKIRVGINLRNVRVRQGWICFGKHKRIGMRKDR
jgi:hypothetical protein